MLTSSPSTAYMWRDLRTPHFSQLWFQHLISSSKDTLPKKSPLCVYPIVDNFYVDVTGLVVLFHFALGTDSIFQSLIWKFSSPSSSSIPRAMSILSRSNANMGNPLFHELKKQASFFLKEKIKTARLVLTDVTPAQLWVSFLLFSPFLGALRTLFRSLISPYFCYCWILIFEGWPRTLSMEIHGIRRTHGRWVESRRQLLKLTITGGSWIYCTTGLPFFLSFLVLCPMQKIFRSSPLTRITNWLFALVKLGLWFSLSRSDKKNWRISYNSLIVLEHLLTHGPESVAEEFQSDKDIIAQAGSFQYIDEKGCVFHLVHLLLPLLCEPKGKNDNLAGSEHAIRTRKYAN